LLGLGLLGLGLLGLGLLGLGLLGLRRRPHAIEADLTARQQRQSQKRDGPPGCPHVAHSDRGRE
jgi:hypothetical protein